MEAYKCAYRDPKSPLTPIPPMDTSNFTLSDFSSIKGLTPRTTQAFRTLSPNNAQTFATLKSTPKTPLTHYAVQKTPGSVRSFSRVQKNFTNNIESTSKTVTKSLFYEESDGNVTIQKSYRQSCTTVTTTTVPDKPTRKSLPPSFTLKPDTFRCSTFKKCSPVQPKPLCLKLARLLSDIGLSRYNNLFEEQEVDYYLFLELTEEDLYDLGVKCKADREIMLNAICYYGLLFTEPKGF